VVRNGVLGGSTVVELLDAEVREEVRRSGVDPLVDADAVRRFARSAVAGHDQRSLSGVVRPVDDPDAVVEELVAGVAGFGPLQKYLDDPEMPFGIWPGNDARRR
jgi:pilus assembly protein CpaF